MKLYNFLYDVNLYKISQYFLHEEVHESPYHIYKSKDFYGATIRTEKEIEDYQYQTALLAVRFKGHGFSDGQFDRLTGIKMDIIGNEDRRMNEIDIALDTLDYVKMEITWKNGLITMTDVQDAQLLLSLHDEKNERTGTITFITLP